MSLVPLLSLVQKQDDKRLVLQGKIEVLANGVIIDHSKALVPQVGQLGSAYDAWTHEALPGIPRLFGPDFMELFSNTPWYMIPLIWVPNSIICMLVSSSTFGHSAVAILWRALIGVALWQLTEYVLHRFAFHYVPTSRWGITFHFLMHGIHHKYPSDPLRLVFPVLPSIAMTAFLVSFFKMFLPWSELFPMASGFMLGYIMYDCTHYFVHHIDTKNNTWLDLLRASHMEHHYRDHTHGYGITTSFFDWVCSTVNQQQLWTETAKVE